MWTILFKWTIEMKLNTGIKWTTGICMDYCNGSCSDYVTCHYITWVSSPPLFTPHIAHPSDSITASVVTAMAHSTTPLTKCSQWTRCNVKTNSTAWHIHLLMIIKYWAHYYNTMCQKSYVKYAVCHATSGGQLLDRSSMRHAVCKDPRGQRKGSHWYITNRYLQLCNAMWIKMWRTQFYTSGACIEFQNLYRSPAFIITHLSHNPLLFFQAGR